MVLLLIALAIITTVVLLFVGARSVTGAGRVIGAPGMFRGAQPITSVTTIVREPARENLIGREVILDDVPVLGVPGDYTFWVGTGEEAVPVVLRGELTGRQRERETEIREGQRVRIFGTLRQMRSVAAIDDFEILSAEAARAIAKSEVYVSATRVDVIEGEVEGER